MKKNFHRFKSIALLALIYLVAFLIYSINPLAQISTPIPVAEAPAPAASDKATANTSAIATTPTSNPTATTANSTTTTATTPSVPPATSAPVAPTSPAVKKKSFNKVYALFETSMGNFKALLFHRQTPKTVENFVDLAEGKKAWLDPKTKDERTTPFYDGLTFHAVRKGFIISTGDPTATGAGGSGKKIDDEFRSDLLHDRPGLLSMANRGPNTAESQFFITLREEKSLNKRNVIFGEIVEGFDIVQKISQVPVNRANDKPKTDVVIKKVTIIRE